MKTSLTEVDN